MVDLFGTSLMSASFLTDSFHIPQTHIHTVRVESVSSILTTEAMLKSCALMQCGNGFILSMASLLWASALPTGPGLRRHIFFKLLCLSLPGSLSIFFLPFFLCLSSLRFSSSESRMQGFGRWVRLSHLAPAEWNVCVCVCSSTYAGARFSCSVNFGELIWFMTYLLSKRRTDI